MMLLLAACGDWTAGDSSKDDRFHGRFHYFYTAECRYDNAGPYDCTDMSALSPHMTAELRVEYDGFASLRIDDETSRYYEEEYTEGLRHDLRGGTLAGTRPAVDGYNVIFAALTHEWA